MPEPKNLIQQAIFATKFHDISKFLRRTVGPANVSDQPFEISQSCLDEVTKKVFGMGTVQEYIVARPRQISQVQKILRYANENKIFVFVRGAGTGYFGGELPTREGIVIETTGLDRIRQFDKESGFVVCDAGISVSALNSYLRTFGYWWPHNPGSRQWATVGGSLVTLGIGTFSTRFGYASDSLLSLKLVSPTGHLIEINSRSAHDMLSYNLLGLFCSSEGALGIIVQAKLKVFPLPKTREASIYFFHSISDAMDAASEIIESGANPEALEIEDVERFTLEGLAPVIELQSKRVQALHLDKVRAALFVNSAGSREQVKFASSHVSFIVKKCQGWQMTDEKITNLYWKSKTEVSSWALQNSSSRSKVHTFVPSIPLSKIAKFEEAFWKIGRKYPKIKPLGVGYYTLIQNRQCTASARVMLDEADEQAIRQYEVFIHELASQVQKLGGSLASTFGLGTILVDLAKEYTSPSWQELSSKLKTMLDPKGILSPGKKG